MKYSKYTAALILCCSSSLTPIAHAGNYEYAEVTQVDAITRIVTTKIPHESCWNEEVQVRSRHNNVSKTPQLLGALIGGGIGNALGHHSSNQKVGAVVGAVLGASVASDMNRTQSTSSYRTVTERRCETDYKVEEKEKVVGYRVSYAYGDKIYQTRRSSHPGDKLKIIVDITPVE